MVSKNTKISFDKSPAGLHRVYGKYRTVCCHRTMNVRAVWQTTYCLHLFGCVALQYILFDLNEFRRRFLWYIFFNEESLILKLALGLNEMIYFLTNSPSKNEIELNVYSMQNDISVSQAFWLFQFQSRSLFGSSERSESVTIQFYLIC